MGSCVSPNATGVNPGPPCGTGGLAAMVAVSAVALAMLGPVPRDLGAQSGGPPLVRGFALEQDGRFAEAADAYRAAMGGADGNMAAALLGLERAYAALGVSDSLLPLLDSLIEARPAERIFRSIQLRTLHLLGRGELLRAAFESWVDATPGDAGPYREYAQMLLRAGRSLAADTVLQRAQRDLGSARELYYEIAQLRAALGLWAQSAEAWAAALARQPGLQQAATLALVRTPPDERPAVRRAFRQGPREIAVRGALAGLELRWGEPGRAWEALADLPVSDETVQAWRAFAGAAEDAHSWMAASEALGAVFAATDEPGLAIRAGVAALEGGDAERALSFARSASGAPGDSIASEALKLEVRALSELGRPGDAEERLAESGRRLTGGELDVLRRAIAWGWVRAGDIARARRALASANAGTDGSDALHGATAGWLALYEGDLAAARDALRGTLPDTPDAVLALSILARTGADSAPSLGGAFLALARSDTAGAVAAFIDAAALLPDVAALLLAAAARLHAVRGEDGQAAPLWERIVTWHESAPEAAEADLEWARILRRQGRNADAIARLEHLILSYPRSALVPQARRELELARGGTPSTS